MSQEADFRPKGAFEKGFKRWETMMRRADGLASRIAGLERGSLTHKIATIELRSIMKEIEGLLVSLYKVRATLRGNLQNRANPDDEEQKKQTNNPEALEAGLRHLLDMEERLYRMDSEVQFKMALVNKLEDEANNNKDDLKMGVWEGIWNTY
mmetsp:Transcript_8658/g.15979  ORF Transcript_8658/g.15979 Transcript_8658/m.15979 type:complete len:152 (-) Transcript_8658:108-563(-)|eukprot:CAMPEP_0197523936 /NCGR_PEP_ID=MMETSP1318-20131121/8751_1 /TAXON_ID=552666 /ORGANISM="Partenskyella glossopodia, Strain RCC365" /LENGTH=151 /DNA_ID=CAMNT_0043076767 /DNA_START=42 /DNA_END=497 /DNA_ORIENTATION=-